MFTFQSEDFFSVVETHNGQPLRLYVYSSMTDQCREVTLIPNLSWGGDGMLGCEIGFGYLHRIPSPQQAPAPPTTVNQFVKPSQQQITEPQQQNAPPLCDFGYPAYPPPLASHSPVSFERLLFSKLCLISAISEI